MEYQEDVEYMVSDSVFTKVCTLALEQLHICEGKKDVRPFVTTMAL